MSQAYQCDVCKEFKANRPDLTTGGQVLREVKVWEDFGQPQIRVSLSLAGWDRDARMDVCTECCQRLLRQGLTKMGWLPPTEQVQEEKEKLPPSTVTAGGIVGGIVGAL